MSSSTTASSKVTPSTSYLSKLDLAPHKTSFNLCPAELVQRAVAGGASLAANGALVCMTATRTGRSPADKYRRHPGHPQEHLVGQGQQADDAGEV